MSIATFPEENLHLAGASSACPQPSAPTAHSADSHKMMMMGSHEAAGGAMAGLSGLSGGHGGGTMSELQNELEGIQAGIHQVPKYFFMILTTPSGM